MPLLNAVRCRTIGTTVGLFPELVRLHKKLFVQYRKEREKKRRIRRLFDNGDHVSIAHNVNSNVNLNKFFFV